MRGIFAVNTVSPFLLGENNSGKTSVLESIFLLSGISNPQLALNINLMHGLNVAEDSLKYIFHNLETNDKPLIIGDFSQNTNRKIEISPIFEKNVVSKEIDTSLQDNSSSVLSAVPLPEILGLDYAFTIKRIHEQMY
ncbi:MAG: hypothetical protein LBK58_15375 [Prevotellaceae bacterium]|nr:hypothetical protein [Prevotellaceae bacterium]